MFKELIKSILFPERPVEKQDKLTLDSTEPVENSFFPGEDNMPELPPEDSSFQTCEEDGISISELIDYKIVLDKSDSALADPFQKKTKGPNLPAGEEKKAPVLNQKQNEQNEQNEQKKKETQEVEPKKEPPERTAVVYDRLFRALIHYLNRQFDNRFSDVITSYEKSFSPEQTGGFSPEELAEEKTNILKELTVYFKKEAVALIERDMDFITGRMLDQNVLTYIDKLSGSYSEDFILMVLIEAFFEKKHINTIEDFPEIKGGEGTGERS